MKKVTMLGVFLLCGMFLVGCSGGDETSEPQSQETSVAESSEVVEINETTELIEETTEPTQENKNLDENNVLVNYPYTLEFDNAIYDIKSIKHETGAMTGSPILIIEMEYTNKTDQPQSPYMSFVSDFDVQQTDGTTTSSLNGANSEFGNLENQEAVEMGNANVNSGATVTAIIGYTLEYDDQQTVFVYRPSMITGENSGFIVK